MDRTVAEATGRRSRKGTPERRRSRGRGGEIFQSRPRKQRGEWPAEWMIRALGGFGERARDRRLEALMNVDVPGNRRVLTASMGGTLGSSIDARRTVGRVSLPPVVSFRKAVCVHSV